MTEFGLIWNHPIANISSGTKDNLAIEFLAFDTFRNSPFSVFCKGVGRAIEQL